MTEDLNIIKKKYGEKMAHFCRDAFPSVLETSGLLPKILEDNFDENHFLYDDICREFTDGSFISLGNYDKDISDIVLFKNFINSIASGVEEKLEVTTRTPEELMDEAGYILVECHNESDIQKFKRFYEKGETLCTFNGGRLDRCRVFFAVKKNIDEIDRKDFSNPDRQDEYGTSILSIQFTKDGTNTLSIKNRYNMKVENPDATFGNNLDNIIPGLTYAFQKYKGLKQVFTSDRFFELSNYIHANDGKFYRYNREENNIYYCTNNVIIDNFEVKKFDTSRYLIIQNFIVDMKEKKIRLYDERMARDSIQDVIPEILKIEVEKVKNSSKKVIFRGSNDEYMELVIDKNSRITSIVMKNIRRIGDNFLHDRPTTCYVESVSLEGVQIIGNNFMAGAYVPKHFLAPDLQIVGDNFLSSNRYLTKLYLPNLLVVGDNFLRDVNDLREAYLPNLMKAGKCFFETLGDDFFETLGIKVFYAPKLVNVWELKPKLRKLRKASRYDEDIQKMIEEKTNERANSNAGARI